jgi:peptide deformylase
MQKKILQKEEKVLREIAKEVPIEEIKTAKIKKILKEMKEALESQSDGVAIAAPQIGYPLRIFIVAGKVFTTEFLDKNTLQTDEQIDNIMLLKANNEPVKEYTMKKNTTFINPRISRLSHKKEWLPEGCLSVRPLFGKTFRSIKATITAYDENGNKFTRGASGLLAQIFQHETDHLNGILFIDHAKDIKEEELPPNK